MTSLHGPQFVKVMAAAVIVLLAWVVTPAWSEEALWIYSQSVDQMRGGTTITAKLSSENTLHFEFPYDASNNRASLWLWKIDSTGQQMGVSVDSGQFSCNEFAGDRIAIKIDDDPIDYVECETGAEGVTDIIYFGGDVRPLVSRILTSKRLIIEAEFYAHGREQMVFNTSGLNW